MIMAACCFSTNDDNYYYGGQYLLSTDEAPSSSHGSFILLLFFFFLPQNGSERLSPTSVTMQSNGINSHYQLTPCFHGVRTHVRLLQQSLRLQMLHIWGLAGSQLYFVQSYLSWILQNCYDDFTRRCQAELVSHVLQIKTLGFEAPMRWQYMQYVVHTVHTISCRSNSHLASSSLLLYSFQNSI